jgi:hypothetical protein
MRKCYITLYIEIRFHVLQVKQVMKWIFLTLAIFLLLAGGSLFGLIFATPLAPQENEDDE